MAAISPDDDHRDDRAMLSSALGLTVGSVAGMLFAGDVAPTTARVRFLDLGAIAGGLTMGGLILTASHDDPAPAMAGVSIGSAIGLGLAWWLTSDMPKDQGAEAPRTSTTIVPMVTPQRGGMTLGVAAVF